MTKENEIKKLGLKAVSFQDEFLQCQRDSTKRAIL